MSTIRPERFTGETALPEPRLFGFDAGDPPPEDWPLTLSTLQMLDDRAIEGVAADPSLHGLQADLVGFAMCGGAISRRLYDVILGDGFSEYGAYSPVADWDPEWGGEPPENPRDMRVPADGWPMPGHYGPFEVLYQQASEKTEKLFQFIDSVRAQTVRKAATVAAAYSAATDKLRRNDPEEPLNHAAPRIL